MQERDFPPSIYRPLMLLVITFKRLGLGSRKVTQENKNHVILGGCSVIIGNVRKAQISKNVKEIKIKETNEMNTLEEL